ncbi:MAG: dTDP-glucose 4,6-dehydratase [Kiritimatiellae bacterium]|nr:dTDP-glucose 4,6-dehydratase [Kiritimatiellia bacterium]
MRLLVTGGAGFIGSNFVRWMLQDHADVELVNFDALTYAGNLENLAGLEDDPRYTFVKGDVTDRACVEAVFARHAIETVVHFAAESHVDRSLHFGSLVFVQTNVVGTQTLLEAARAHAVKRFVQVSTDEVYGSLGSQGRFTETSPIQPNNPYAASKAGADFLVRAAHQSYGLDAVITRCSNNFGPYQFPEKLIPLMVANALEDKPLPVYGDGMHVRDWIYVLDHCRAIDVVVRKGTAGELYNIGGTHDVPNLDVVRGILRILDKPESLIRFVKDRPGHDRRYAMDAGKIRAELGWQPAGSFEDALEATVRWYVENREWWERIRTGAYREYYQKLYGNR